LVRQYVIKRKTTYIPSMLIGTKILKKENFMYWESENKTLTESMWIRQMKEELEDETTKYREAKLKDRVKFLNKELKRTKILITYMQNKGE